MKTKFIINPSSGRGRLASPAALTELKAWFGKRLGKFEYVLSRNRDDLMKQTRSALEKDYQRIVAVGGDGTVNAVASAFFKDGQLVNDAAELAVAELGTGSDYYRSIEKNYGSKTDWKEIVTEGKSMPVDVIEVSLNGGALQLISVNMVGLGISPEIVQSKEKNPAWLPSLLGYIYPTVRTIPLYRPKPVEIEMDGQKKSMDLLAAFISKGGFAGGGMRFGGQASLDDGRLGVLLVPKLSVLKMFTELKGVYDGGFESIPGVISTTAEKIKIISRTEEVYPLEVDGEYELGTPVELKVRSKALRLVCCSSG